RALNKKDMGEIVTLISKKLIDRCKEQMELKLTISPVLKKYIVDKFTDTKMGARPIKRAIQSEIEDKLAEEILKKNIVFGDTVTATRKNDETVFVKKEAK
ncbi:MAG: ATP-dependent Clp protease ATP-binding subunit ClpC, partial [Lachnospiraceae bacterium]|nr:ATP-dependent Clp protease ATP-binding subunit ClpC [Lachnospiraceae bacterium]